MQQQSMGVVPVWSSNPTHLGSRSCLGWVLLLLLLLLLLAIAVGVHLLRSVVFDYVCHD